MHAITINKIRFSLLALFAFTLANSIAVNNIIEALILLYWLLLCDKTKTLKLVRTNPIVFAAMLFFLIHVIALLWSQDLNWGLHIVGKESKFLILPILMIMIKKDEISLLTNVFIVAMAITELISYLIWFHITPPIFSASYYDPSPFMGHISYSPFLSFTVYLLLHALLFEKGHSLFYKISASILSLSMSIDIFITSGRAGQVAFFAVLIIILFQFYGKNIKKAVIASLILVPLIFSFAYFQSPIFRNRIDQGINNIKIVKEDPNTSVGLRITFWLNSLQIIEHHPVFGVGTGDFPQEYKKINAVRTPDAIATVQPHNMYLLVWSETGIFGLLSLLWLLYLQIKSSRIRYVSYYRIRAALPLIFVVIMFSDSYLLGHFTTSLFIFFSALLYRDISWQSIKF